MHCYKNREPCNLRHTSISFHIVVHYDFISIKLMGIGCMNLRVEDT